MSDTNNPPTPPNENGDGKPVVPPVDPLTVDIRKTVDEAVEKARKQERDKLYPEIETLKNADKENKAVIARLIKAEEELKAIKEASNTDEATKGKKGTPGLPADKLEEIIASVQKKAEEAYAAKLSELNTQIATLTKDLSDKELASYRDRLISENAAAIIPELVTGSNTQELDQSLVAAKQAFARLTERLKGGNANPTGGQPLVPTPTSHSNVPPGGNEADVSRLSPTEYAKQRQELLRQAGEAVRKNYGVQ